MDDPVDQEKKIAIKEEAKKKQLEETKSKIFSMTIVKKLTSNYMHRK